MRSRLRTLALFTCVVVAGCSTATSIGSYSLTPTSSTGSTTARLVYGLDAVPDLVAYNATIGTPVWVSKLSGDTGSGQLLVSGDTIYLLDNYLTAFRATDGTQLWQIPASQGQMFLGNDTLYVLAAPGSPQELYAVNSHNGAPRWRVQLHLMSSPTQHDNAEIGIYQDGVIYLATDSGAAALSASTGQQLWYTSTSIEYVFTHIVWTPHALLVQNSDASAPSNQTDAPCGCLVSAFDPTTGKLLWDYSNLGNPGLAPLYSVISPTLGFYQVTFDALTSFNIATGHPLWSVPFHLIAFGGVVTHWQITPTAIILVDGFNGGDLVALDARTGTQLWTDQSADTYATSALGDSAVYVLGSYGVQAYSMATGQELWAQNQPASNPQLQADTRVSALDNLVLVTHYSLSNVGGAPVYIALDGRTGKQLWTSQTNGVVSVYTSVDVTSPTLTLPPPPILPNATAAAAAIAGCSTGSSQYFENPPGPLPTTIPLPPGTLVQDSGMGYAGDGAVYSFCTPGATPAGITAYMDSALPAAGWTSTAPQGCNLPPGLWYKGHYGIQIDVAGFSPPDMWAIDVTNVGSTGC